MSNKQETPEQLLRKELAREFFTNGSVRTDSPDNQYIHLAVKIIKELIETGEVIDMSRTYLEETYKYSGITSRRTVQYLFESGFITRYDVAGTTNRNDNPTRSIDKYTIVCEDKLVDTLKKVGFEFLFEQDDLPRLHNKAIRIHNAIARSEINSKKRMKEERIIYPLRQEKVVKGHTKTTKNNISEAIGSYYERLLTFTSLISDDDVKLISSGSYLGTKVVLGKVINELDNIDLLLTNILDSKRKEKVAERLNKSRELIGNIMNVINAVGKDLPGDSFMEIILGIYKFE